MTEHKAAAQTQPGAHNSAATDDCHALPMLTGRHDLTVMMANSSSQVMPDLLSCGLRQGHITLDDFQGLLKARVLQQPRHPVTAISGPPNNDLLQAKTSKPWQQTCH